MTSGRGDQQPQEPEKEVEWIDFGGDEIELRGQAPETILNRMFGREDE